MHIGPASWRLLASCTGYCSMVLCIMNLIGVGRVCKAPLLSSLPITLHLHPYTSSISCFSRFFIPQSMVEKVLGLLLVKRFIQKRVRHWCKGFWKHVQSRSDNSQITQSYRQLELLFRLMRSSRGQHGETPVPLVRISYSRQCLVLRIKICMV